MTVDEAKALVGSGDAIDFETRISIFCNRAIVVVGLHKQTPRAQTIEKAHIERGAGIVGDRRSKYDSEEVRFRAEAARLRDREERAAEELARWDAWRDLTVEFFRQLIKEIPADEYDRAEREARGRPLLLASEERTTIGIDPFSSPTDPWSSEDEFNGLTIRSAPDESEHSNDPEDDPDQDEIMDEHHQEQEEAV